MHDNALHKIRIVFVFFTQNVSNKDMEQKL